MTAIWPHECPAPLDQGDGPEAVEPPRTWYGAGTPDPVTPAIGDRWVNTSSGTVAIWDGAAWVVEGGG